MCDLNAENQRTALKLVLDLATPKGCKAESTQMARLNTEPVTHPTNIPAQRRTVTSLNRRTTLPLRQTANAHCVQRTTYGGGDAIISRTDAACRALIVAACNARLTSG